MTNCYGYRAVKTDGLYRAEYRVERWGRWRIVCWDNGKPKLFQCDYEAELCGAGYMKDYLNSNITAWRSTSTNELRERAERLFKPAGTPIHESQNEESAQRSTAQNGTA